MAKMFMSLGFWMTIVLFIALGYAFDRAWGAECAGSVNSINCGYMHATRGSSISPVSWNSPDENQNFQIENELNASNDVRRHRCANNASPRTDYPDFQQMANLQAGDAPVRVEDPENGAGYFLVKEEMYRRMRGLVGLGLETGPLTIEEQRAILAHVGRRAGWDDPAMDY